MFELIIIMCLNGDLNRCQTAMAVTPDCVSAYSATLAAAPKEAVVKAISCVRRVDMVLPPMTVKPEEKPKVST